MLHPSCYQPRRVLRVIHPNSSILLKKMIGLNISVVSVIFTCCIQSVRKFLMNFYFKLVFKVIIFHWMCLWKLMKYMKLFSWIKAYYKYLAKRLTLNINSEKCGFAGKLFMNLFDSSQACHEGGSGTRPKIDNKGYWRWKY